MYCVHFDEMAVLPLMPGVSSDEDSQPVGGDGVVVGERAGTLTAANVVVDHAANGTAPRHLAFASLIQRAKPPRRCATPLRVKP